MFHYLWMQGVKSNMNYCRSEKLFGGTDKPVNSREIQILKGKQGMNIWNKLKNDCTTRSVLVKLRTK